MTLIGLSGYARSGKDTAAQALAQDGFQRIAFADLMRDFLYRLNPIVGKHESWRVADVIDDVGWDGYKTHELGYEIRELMQRLGTECGRDLLGENIWVDSALRNLDKSKNYVVTDCRFLNEAYAITKRNGYLIRINRPGVGPANDHSSEISLDDYKFDAVISNDGEPEALRNKILEVVWPA